jgi:glycosyltransferase involved in cell wall biosynthesis
VVWVDDGSTDGSTDWLAMQTLPPHWQVVHHAHNQGKGKALHTGVLAAQGNVVLFHDADTEYDPADWWAVVAPVLGGEVQAMFGSRFRSRQRLPVGYWPYAMANWGLNALLRYRWHRCYQHRLFITDLETGMKAMARGVALALPWQATDFAIEPEMTLALVRGKVALAEVPISYRPRSVRQGKKIGWRDAVKAAHLLWHV